MGLDLFWQNQTYLAEFLSLPHPPLAALTWHMYLLNRTAEPDRILNPAILDTTKSWADGYTAVMAEKGEKMDLWLTETGR